MATPKTSKSTMIEALIELIAASGAGSDELMIVNKTIATRLFTLIPEKTLQEFLRGANQNLPALGQPGLKYWLKTKRAALQCSQKALALKLQMRGLKIHASDIGNLETNKRIELYTPERVSRIVSAIEALVIEEAS